MKADARIERAQRWLNEQIDQLKSLRNAKVRDTEFKQWRQATLTIVQRVWPGDARRSTRFRRIPFSPPSTQASGRETRESYERGCAEALQLLNGFLEDIESNGLPEAGEAARPASLDPGMAEDDFPTVDLPGGASDPAPEPAESEAEAEPESRPEPKSKPEKAPAAKASAPKAEESREEKSATAGGHGTRRNGERRKRQKHGGPRRRLRDMLGLDALEKLGRNRDASEDETDEVPVQAEEAATKEAPEQAEAPEVAETASEASEDAPVATDAEPEVQTEEADESTPDADEPEPAVAQSDEPDDADEAEEETSEDESSEAETTLSTHDFLSASPVFRAEGKPVRRARRETQAPPPDGDLTPVPLTCGTAIALAAIASEVTRLGVPEGQRARTRASLIALAQLVEDGTIDWEGMRSAMAFAMEFPPIARRLIPLLIPYLDKAA